MSSGVGVLARKIKLAMTVVVELQFSLLGLSFSHSINAFGLQAQPEVHSGDTERSEILFDFLTIQL